MDENKPLETDAVEESQEEFDELGDLFEAGDEDGTSGAPETEGLSLEQLSAIVGRPVKSVDDFQKHYKNLTSFVGKKTEPKPEPEQNTGNKELEELRNEILGLKSTVLEKDFVSENPEAKEHITLVKKVAKADGISLSEAWESVKDIAVSASEHKKSLVGVSSKNRINPQQEKKLQQLGKKAMESGNIDDQEAFVAAALGLK